MAKLYGKNHLKKMIDGHNDVVVAKINLLNKVIAMDRNYVADVIAKEWMGRMIPVPTLVYTPWTRDGYLVMKSREPIKHKKNFDLIMLEWSFLEEDPVRP